MTAWPGMRITGTVPTIFYVWDLQFLVLLAHSFLIVEMLPKAVKGKS